MTRLHHSRKNRNSDYTCQCSHAEHLRSSCGQMQQAKASQRNDLLAACGKSYRSIATGRARRATKGVAMLVSTRSLQKRPHCRLRCKRIVQLLRVWPIQILQHGSDDVALFVRGLIWLRKCHKEFSKCPLEVRVRKSRRRLANLHQFRDEEQNFHAQLPNRRHRYC